MLGQFADYTFEKVIFRSEKAVIYKAVQEAGSSPVLVKLLNETFPTIDSIARLKREYELANSLSEKGALKCYDFKESNNQWGIVMEFFPGVPIRCLGKKDTPLPLDLFFKIALKLVDAVGKIHESKTILKNINPRNIFYDEETEEIRLLDLGVSQKVGLSGAGSEHFEVLDETLPYIAPEQTGRVNLIEDYRSDFYSLGITFFQMLTGKLPFYAEDVLGWIHCHLSQPPLSPQSLTPTIPDILAQIILLLLDKNPSHRYQSAYGLLIDLGKVQAQWQADQTTTPFPLHWKLSSRLNFSDSPIGQESELENLLQGMKRIIQGKTGLTVIKGMPGVGKSTLVQHFLKHAKEQHIPCFIGQYPQGQSEEPYRAIRTVAQQFIRQALSLPEDIFESVKSRFLHALEGNGQVLIDFLEEFEKIIGPQEPVSEISGEEAKYRFLSTFTNFMRAACNKPTVIVLEDLQWADAASLSWLSFINSTGGIKNLLTIWSIRENEVGPQHPLTLFLNQLEEEKKLYQIQLSPLDFFNTKKIVAQTLFYKTGSITELSSIVYEKTRGNPFFIGQLLKTMVQQDSLKFSHDQGIWVWDVGFLKSMAIQENVVDLIVLRIEQIDEQSKALLQIASCFQQFFTPAQLSYVSNRPLEHVVPILTTMSLESLVFLEPKQPFEVEKEGFATTVYRFSHSEIQQILYSSLLPEEKATYHAKIGQMLLEEKAPKNTIVRHLNAGRTMLENSEQKFELAQLNLDLAIQSRQTTAYDNAFHYSSVAQELLPTDVWSHHYSLGLGIYKEMSLSAFYSRHYAISVEQDRILLENVRTPLEKAEIHLMQTKKLMARWEIEVSVEKALQGLSILGLSIPEKIHPHLLEEAYQQLDKTLRSLTAEEIINLPQSYEPKYQLLMELLSHLVILQEMLTQSENSEYVLCQSLQLSLQHGIAPTTPYCFVAYGAKEISLRRNPARGFEIATIGVQLVKRLNLAEFKGRTLHEYSVTILPWIEPRNKMLAHLQEAIEAERQMGDLNFWSFSLGEITRCSPQLGVDETVQWCEKAVDFCRKNFFRHDSTILTASRWLNYQGKTKSRFSLDSELLTESQFLENPHAYDIGMFHLEKMWIHFLYDDFQTAQQHSQAARNKIKIRICHQDYADYSFLAFLIESALWLQLPEEEKLRSWNFLEEEHEKMCFWAQSCPENFDHHVLMQKAEFARLKGNTDQAAEFYDQSIQHAHNNLYLQHEAIAYELAGRFWLDQELEKIGLWYLYESYVCYEKWGATEKLKQLEEDYQLLARLGYAESDSSPEEAVMANDSLLDKKSLVKMSNALAEEFELEKLVPKLLTIALENAGAEKVILLLKKTNSEEWLIQAQSLHEGEFRKMGKLALDGKILAASVVQYVSRTRSKVVLDNAIQHGNFTKDSYIQRHKVSSLLCLPLLYRESLVGVLYLENSRIPHAFTMERLSILETIVAQAAISLQNAQLYNALKDKMTEVLSTTDKLQEETRKSARLESELQTAAAIQSHFLPEPELVLPPLNIASYYASAKETGGDWYGWLTELEGTLFILIGDVTGHGTPSALITAAICAACYTLKNLYEAEKTKLRPAEILEFINKTVCQAGAPKYLMTFLAASIDLASGQITYANAGHTFPILIREGKEKTLLASGPRLGDVPDTPFVEKSMQLEQGDLLFFYTDGLSECENPQGKMWGVRSVVRFLKANQHESASFLVQQIVQQMNAFTQTDLLDDDVTFVCCQVTHPFTNNPKEYGRNNM